jgi:hypothetical protein
MFLAKTMKLFTAKDARNELLIAILNEISDKAKNGCSSYHYFEPLSDECINLLIALGYKVKHQEPPTMSVTEHTPNGTITQVYDDHYIISW